MIVVVVVAVMFGVHIRGVVVVVIIAVSKGRHV